MRLVALAAVLVMPACQLYFTGDDVADDEPCLRPEVPAYTQHLVNPTTLACEAFTQSGCDDQCGPCPGSAIYIPPWGECTSPCVGLSESACMADDRCRVARSFSEYYRSTTVDDFMGCYPLNTGAPPDVQRCEGLDAEQCAWQADCTALYDGAPGACAGIAPEACAGAQFRECITEARTEPGLCTPASCRQVPPACPTGTTAGVENGCYTGACIPNSFCAVAGF